MSQSSFAQSLFSSACVTGVIFSATALPFAALKSNVINVELQNQPIFSSELQYLAAPYLTVAGGMSAAVGLGVFGILGWRNSARKLADTTSSHADLAKSLAAHQAELERIKFSESRLQTQNLASFLQPETPWSSASHPVMAPHPVAVAQPVMTTPHPVAFDVSHPSSAAAQPSPVVTSSSPSIEHEPSRPTLQAVEQEPIESLLMQLQQLSRQVEELRNHSSQQLAA